MFSSKATYLQKVKSNKRAVILSTVLLIIVIATTLCLHFFFAEVIRPPTISRDYSKHPVDMAKEPIDISYILESPKGRFNRYPELFVMLVSILERSTCPINFHFFVDEPIRKIVDHFFEGKNVTEMGVNYKFGSQQPAIDALEGLETSWETRSALVKGSPELILGQEVKHTLILDFDMILIDDICGHYYKLKEQVKEHGFLSASEPGKCYFPNEELDFLAMPCSKDSWIGCGFNAGALMVNLENLRKWNWTAKYKKVFQDKISGEWKNQKSKVLKYPEQNVINYMGRLNSTYATYMSDAMNSQLTFGKPSVLKQHIDEIVIVHGNAFLFAKYNNYYRKLWWLFLSNGNLYGMSYRPSFFGLDDSISSKDLLENPALMYQERANVRLYLSQALTNAE